MSSSVPHRKASLATRIVGVATALMCALAGGAVWCLLALYTRIDFDAMLLPIAALVAVVLRNHGFARSRTGIVLAIGGTVLAFAYSAYLLAAAKVAAYLGLPLRSTLLAIGPEMAAAIARADFTPWHAGMLVLSCMLAAWMIWRSPARQRGSQ
ncbi:MAG TPA: hypothetical protein PKO41_08810 [Dokdonella sp.]|uniref:hypothetical protein n=1 Tax=Dokdonella sp. TaxID=2291710 RepID=UPI0025C5233A|nr:hypothetical protein [Dokdonella sp.]MBX3691948.1 hypothetical protein [Dokdonella sp.]MCW5567432.1 hypothetical protein [Dokdonella sp.]HNR92512.1 hypothetical protein [Dokdonella sp.]